MSIRARLTRLLLLTIVPLVLAVGAGVFLVVRAALVARFDGALESRARTLKGMVKVAAGVIETDFAEDAAARRDRGPEGGEFFELWEWEHGKPGRVVERSWSLGTRDLEPRAPEAEPTPWNGPLPGGPGKGRFIALRFSPPIDPDTDHDESSGPPDPGGVRTFDLMLVVGHGREDLDRTLLLLLAALGGAGVLLGVGVAAAVRVSLERGLAPIADLAAQVGSIGPADLSARLDSAGSPPELAPIAERTNAMLDRLSAAFDREKRLAAGAAHELRTPIAEIRAVSELALGRERAPEDYRRALATILGAAERMGASADAVLRLARVQSGHERAELGPVGVREALAPAWQRRIEPLRAREVRIALEIPPGILALADPGMLGVMFDNLCANAAEHTPRGGDVRAECVQRAEARLTLRISNTAAHRGPHTVSAPSHRATAQGGAGHEPIHAGLGLLIAGAMAEACGGSLEASVRDDRFVVSIHLRRAGPARGRPMTVDVAPNE